MMTRPTRAALAALFVVAAGAALAAEGDGVARVTLADFKKELDQKKVLVVDVRGQDTYRKGHIPGAISVPLSTLGDEMARLKASKKPIVTYCA